MNDNREFSRLAMEQFARTVEGQTMIIRDGEIAGKVINVRVTDDGKVMATLTFLGGEHVEFRIGSFERRPGLDPMFCTCGPDAHLLRERCTVCRAAATRAHRAAIDEEIAKAVNSAAVRFTVPEPVPVSLPRFEDAIRLRTLVDKYGMSFRTIEPEDLPDSPLLVGPQPEPYQVGTPFTAANLTPDFAGDLKLWDEAIASNGPLSAIGIRRKATDPPDPAAYDPYLAFARAVLALGNSCLAAARTIWKPLFRALDALTPEELAQLRAALAVEAANDALMAEQSATSRRLATPTQEQVNTLWGVPDLYEAIDPFVEASALKEASRRLALSQTPEPPK